ncbi:GATA zinc finger family protein [Candida albicans]|uniref:GATA zinc finger family protein n=1 Tax=Candida albicans TaxID=5476 RepID=A0A8H6F193_CANAX|nr:GATA zinc finger family protein [Candida albicans]
MVTELSIDDINEALVNTKKLANVFENIKSINENSTKSTNDMRRKMDYLKIRKKHQHQMAKTKSLSTNGEAIPMQMSVSRNNGSITSTGFLQSVQQQAPQPQPQSQPQTQHQQLQPASELVPPHTQAQTLSAVTSNLTNGNLNTENPEWRRGPEGSRTLCNACGLFYSKLIKKYGLREADKVMLHRKQTGTVNDRRIF